MKKTLVFVKALDHFDTNNPKTKRCFIWHCGELIEENDEYIRLRTGHYTFEPEDDSGGDVREDLHCILKKMICKIEKVELDWDEES